MSRHNPSKLKTTTVGTVDGVDGVDYPVQVSSSGDFMVEFDGDRLRAPTMKAVVDKLRTAIRAHKRINIEASMLEGRYRRGKEVEAPIDILLTGIHGSNGNVLYRKVDVKGPDANGQLSSYETIFRRLTPAEKAEFIRLRQAAVDAEAALEKWKSSREVKAKEIIQKEVRKIAGPGATDGN